MVRHYKRKRIGYGNIYIAIDKQLGLARIGFSTNLYTTQANLSLNWNIITSCEFDNAGSLDKRIATMLQSERANNYQSSKCYKLDSYRVQKVIKILRGNINYKCSYDYDICSCLGCDEEMEVEYNSVVNIHMLLDIWENKRFCDDCATTTYCAVCKNEIDKDDITCSSACELVYRRARKWELDKSNKKDTPRK